jgi:hypothetical protein
MARGVVGMVEMLNFMDVKLMICFLGVLSLL